MSYEPCQLTVAQLRSVYEVQPYIPVAQFVQLTDCGYGYWWKDDCRINFPAILAMQMAESSCNVGDFSLN